MLVTILTPERKVFEGEADLVKLTGSSEKGSFAIMENHAPIISSLEPGKIKVKKGSDNKEFVIKSGFVEVLKNKISILVEGIESEKL